MEVIRRYLPLAATMVILIVVIIVVPWQQVWVSLRQLNPMTLVWMALLSLIYYFGRVLRLWLMLKNARQQRDLPTVTLTYMAAQPATVLPAGEFMVTLFLKRYADVSVRKGSPVVLMQNITEGLALLLVSLGAAFIVNKGRVLIAIATIGLILFLIGIHQRKLSFLQRWLNKLPFVSLRKTEFNRLMEDHRKLLDARIFASALVLSLIPVVAGILMLYTAAGALHHPIGLLQATIAYSIPVVLAGISLLPGGFGASEGGSVAFLALFGVPITAAIAITLLVRIFTFGFGLLVGAVALPTAHAVKEA